MSWLHYCEEGKAITTLINSTEQFLSQSAQVIAEAKKLGADQAAISLDVESGYSVSVRNQDLEKLVYHDSRAANIVVYKNNSLGHVVTTDLRPDALRQAVTKALTIASKLAADPCNGLADPQLQATDYPDLDLYHPWELSAEQALDKALACEQYALGLDNRIHLTDSCSITNVSDLTIYANSNGFVGHYPSTSHSVMLSLIAKDKDGGMQSDYEYSSDCDATKLASIEEVASKAVENTVGRLGARAVPTGTYPVIFSAKMAKSLVRHFLVAISGSNLYKKQSFLLDKLHQDIFPNFVQIDQSPHLLARGGSLPFDNEGVRTAHRQLIADGVLQSYLMGSYSARRLGLQTTGNSSGAQNVQLHPGDKSLAALLQEMGTGLYITDLLGQGVSVLTGNYSRGAAGFWVENGEIQYPVEGITLAGNLKDMFAGIVAVGTDLDIRGSVAAPSVLLQQMRVAGV